jgi:type I restriction enzyme S subunit
MNIVGASIGRVGYYSLDEVANINQAVCLIRLAKMDCPFDFNFILHFLNSETCISYMYDKKVDNARPNLSMSNISKFLIPLPPLAEQRRIVVKIDQLMTLCNSLVQQINASTDKQTAILDAVLSKI